MKLRQWVEDAVLPHLNNAYNAGASKKSYYTDGVIDSITAKFANLVKTQRESDIRKVSSEKTNVVRSVEVDVRENPT